MDISLFLYPYIQLIRQSINWWDTGIDQVFSFKLCKNFHSYLSLFISYLHHIYNTRIFSFLILHASFFLRLLSVCIYVRVCCTLLVSLLYYTCLFTSFVVLLDGVFFPCQSIYWNEELMFLHHISYVIYVCLYRNLLGLYMTRNNRV